MMRVCPKCGAVLDPGEKCDCGSSCTESSRDGRYRNEPVTRYRRKDNMTPWQRDWIEAGKRP